MIGTAGTRVNESIVEDHLACRFCQLSAVEQPLLTRNNFDIVPSVGSLVEGWLLAVPRRHVVALAELSVNEQHRFVSLIKDITRILEHEYGPVVAFEHGPAQPKRGAGCGIDHGHLHLVPTDADLKSGVAAFQFNFELLWKEASWPWKARTAHQNGNDYLFLREQDGKSWIAESREPIPGQLFRRVLAAHISHCGWDWKTDPRDEVGRATRDRLTGLLA